MASRVELSVDDVSVSFVVVIDVGITDVVREIVEELVRRVLVKTLGVVPFEDTIPTVVEASAGVDSNACVVVMLVVASVRTGLVVARVVVVATVVVVVGRREVVVALVVAFDVNENRA